MLNDTKHWLVEIRAKDWIHIPEDRLVRTVTYEEVLAPCEYSARHAGFNQFDSRSTQDPVLRRHMAQMRISVEDCCAPIAIEVD